MVNRFVRGAFVQPLVSKWLDTPPRPRRAVKKDPEPDKNRTEGAKVEYARTGTPKP